MKFGYIYRVWNLLNGMSYVGQTTYTNPYKRIRKHFCISSSKCTALVQAVEQFGEEKFSFEILEHVPLSELNNRECYWIDRLGTLSPCGYNLTTGGSSHTTYAPSVRKRISDSKSGENNHYFGRPLPDDLKSKLSEALSGENNPMYGKNHSPETIEKMSEAKIGLKNPNYGRPRSEATRRKISETLRRRSGGGGGS